jgi:hypothetical protein
VRWDGVYLRISFTCKSDERNVVAHFIVILADQSTKPPRFFCRDFEALREITLLGRRLADRLPA